MNVLGGAGNDQLTLSRDFFTISTAGTIDLVADDDTVINAQTDRFNTVALIDGGSGNDVFELRLGDSGGTWDLSHIRNFEEIRIEGATFQAGVAVLADTTAVRGASSGVGRRWRGRHVAGDACRWLGRDGRRPRHGRQ